MSGHKCGTVRRCILLLLISCFFTACGNIDDRLEAGNSDVLLTSENAILPGESMIHNFDVDTRFLGKEYIAEEDEKYAIELARKFSSSFSDAKTDEDTYYISQPYPILNIGEGVLDFFLFKNEGCIGIITFSSNSGARSGGSFVEGDFPELTQCLSENTAFVLLSDGFRLWLVSQERSCPLNMQEMIETEISWSKEYLPFCQKLRLTEIKLP